MDRVDELLSSVGTAVDEAASAFMALNSQQMPVPNGSQKVMIDLRDSWSGEGKRPRWE